MMVLANEDVKSRINNIKENYYNYLVLDMESVGEENTQRMELAIEILSIINTVRKANDLYKEVKAPNSIKTDIFYQIIKAIFEDKPFTKEQLSEYHTEISKLQNFYKVISIFDDTVETFIPDEVEILLAGMNLREQLELRKLGKEQNNKISINFSSIIFSSTRFENTIDDYIEKTQQVIYEVRGLLKETEFNAELTL